MKWLLRSVACVLLVLLTGCAGLHACLHADEPDAIEAEKDALWEKLLAARPETAPVGDPALTVVFVDVGQGDCTLFLAPDGRTMLIDAGPVGSFDAIRKALDDYGVQTLDVVIATHPHEDHIGAMADVLRAYRVGQFYTIDVAYPSAPYERMLSALTENGCPVAYCEAPGTIPWSDGCTVTMLNPIQGYDVPDDLNDASLVVRVQYGDTAVLMTGDAGETAEKRMLDTFPRGMLRADVLKLGHHGSRYSNGYSFFLAVDADAAIASCGARNDYGHPHLDTLSLLYVTRTAFYRTDRDGTIVCRLNGTTVSIQPTRKELP